LSDWVEEAEEVFDTEDETALLAVLSAAAEVSAWEASDDAVEEEPVLEDSPQPARKNALIARTSSMKPVRIMFL